MASKVEFSGLALLFRLDESRFALPLEAVLRVLRAVAYTPLPQAPAIIEGLINVRGDLVPVVNLRGRLGLPPRELGLNDHLLIARTPRRKLALPVNHSGGIIAWQASDFAAADQVAPGTRYLKGILKGAAGLILVHDLEALLSLEEEEAIDVALGRAA